MCNACLGDMDELLNPPPESSLPPVGVSFREFNHAAYREAVRELIPIIEDPLTPTRCHRVAEEHFHLERVGWTRYTLLYQELIGAACRRS